MFLTRVLHRFLRAQVDELNAELEQQRDKVSESQVALTQAQAQLNNTCQRLLNTETQLDEQTRGNTKLQVLRAAHAR